MTVAPMGQFLSWTYAQRVRRPQWTRYIRPRYQQTERILLVARQEGVSTRAQHNHFAIDAIHNRSEHNK